MDGGQARDRVAAVDPSDESGNEMLGEIHRAVAEHIGEPGTGCRIDPVDVGEPSARSNSAAIYCGARQVAGIRGRRTVVISSGSSAARAREPGSNPAAPASEIAVIKRRRVGGMYIAHSRLLAINT